MTRVKAAGDAWGGVASFSGVFARVRLPTALVSPLLPAPLRATTKKQPGAGPLEHSLVFFFGELTNGGAHVAGREFTTGIRYREAGVMISDVNHPRCDVNVSFVYAMFADDARPVVLGNAAYGLRKRTARIEWSGARYTAHVDGHDCLVARGALRDGWRPACDAPVMADWLQKVGSPPVLGRRSTGAFVLSRFSWDLSAASLCELGLELKWLPTAGSPVVDLHADRGQSVAVRDMRWSTGQPAALR